jgi:hypothetical protein
MKKIPSLTIFEEKKERKSTIVDDSWIIQREGEKEEQGKGMSFLN